MKRKEAKEYLLTQGRFVIEPKLAKEICKAFGLPLNKKLIRKGSFGYREWGTENVERVNVSALAEDICLKLGKKPDEKTYHTAGMMSGEGSYHDLYSKAHAMNL